MLIVAALCSVCFWCTTAIDSKEASDQRSITLSSGTHYCLRFRNPTIVAVLSELGAASVDVYYSEYDIESSLSNFSYHSTMNSSNNIRAVSFGRYYGMLIFYSSDPTAVFYSFSNRKSQCTSLSVINKPSASLNFPNSTTEPYYTSNTSCLFYSIYGDQAAEVTVKSQANVYSFSDDDSTLLTEGRHSISRSIQYPFFFAVSSSSNASSKIASISLSSSDNEEYDLLVEGAFRSITDIDFLYGYKDHSLNVGEISLIAFGSTVAAASIATFIILRVKSRKGGFEPTPQPEESGSKEPEVA